MKILQAQLASIAVIAILAFPSAAGAEEIAPPGNSAVNQYTETYPTAKGPAATKSRGKKDGRSKARTLPARTVRRLRAEGRAGEEVAAVVAATAPGGPADGGEAGGKPREVRPSPTSVADDGGGSSGFREVVAEATGSSDSDGLGIVLPLLILAAFVASGVYLWRQRRRTA